VALWVARAVAKGRGRHILGHPEHTTETPSRLREPTEGAMLAAAHGDEPGSTVNPVACPVSTNPFTYWGSPCARATPRSTRPLWDRAPTPPLRRRRRARASADHAANAVAPFVRDPSSKQP
jgi:hypothetical protein